MIEYYLHLLAYQQNSSSYYGIFYYSVIKNKVKNKFSESRKVFYATLSSATAAAENTGVVDKLKSEAINSVTITSSIYNLPIIEHGQASFGNSLPFYPVS